MSWGTATGEVASTIAARTLVDDAERRRLALAITLADQLLAGRDPSELIVSDYRAAVAEVQRVKSAS